MVFQTDQSHSFQVWKWKQTFKRSCKQHFGLVGLLNPHQWPETNQLSDFHGVRGLQSSLRGSLPLRPGHHRGLGAAGHLKNWNATNKCPCAHMYSHMNIYNDIYIYVNYYMLCDIHYFSSYHASILSHVAS